jgi:Na+-driven multidrug efflux pump
MGMDSNLGSSVGLSIGTSMGMLIGILYGARKDTEAKKTRKISLGFL